MFKGIISKLKRRRKNRIEYDRKKPLYRFTDRVMTVCLPTALLLIILVFFKKLEPDVAIMSFGSVVVVTIVIMLPFLYDLQRLSEYTKELSAGNVNNTMDIEDFDEDEEVGQIVAAVTKMHSDWQHKSEELHNRSLSNAAIIDGLPDPLLIYDEEGIIINANYVARDLFGLPLKGISVSKIIKNNRVLDNYVKVFSDEDGGEDSEKQIVFIPSKHVNYSIKDRIEEEKGVGIEIEDVSHASINNILEMSVTVERLPGKIGGKMVAVLVFHDVTNIKKLEKMQTDFVANASHELRTPLSVISGTIETIQGAARNDPDAIQKFITLMAEQSFRMELLVEDLLVLSKISFDKDEIFTDYVDVLTKIREVTLAVENKLKAKNMTIHFDAEQEIITKGSEKELYQVFENIVSNAIKYGDADTEITIKAGKVKKVSDELKFKQFKNNAFFVSVHNLGEGVKKEEIERVTERFYRVDTSRNKKIIGSGLGLAIVEHILSRHKGVLDITSNYGKDVTFTIFLPIIN